jgi:hypothetical protein
MDDDDVVFLILVACIAAVHQLICSYHILNDDLPTAYDKRIALKRQRELTPYKRNVSCPLEPKNYLSEILQESIEGTSS